MPLSPRLGQVHLPLPFPEPRAVGVGVFPEAVVAGAAAFVFGALFAGGTAGPPSGDPLREVMGRGCYAGRSCRSPYWK